MDGRLLREWKRVSCVFSSCEDTDLSNSWYCYNWYLLFGAIAVVVMQLSLVSLLVSKGCFRAKNGRRSSLLWHPCIGCVGRCGECFPIVVVIVVLLLLLKIRKSWKKLRDFFLKQGSCCASLLTMPLTTAFTRSAKTKLLQTWSRPLWMALILNNDHISHISSMPNIIEYSVTNVFQVTVGREIEIRRPTRHYAFPGTKKTWKFFWPVNNIFAFLQLFLTDKTTQNAYFRPKQRVCPPCIVAANPPSPPCPSQTLSTSTPSTG